jgi:hypothetical protein
VTPTPPRARVISAVATAVGRASDIPAVRCAASTAPAAAMAFTSPAVTSIPPGPSSRTAGALTMNCSGPGWSQP